MSSKAKRTVNPMTHGVVRAISVVKTYGRDKGLMSSTISHFQVIATKMVQRNLLGH